MAFESDLSDKFYKPWCKGSSAVDATRRFGMRKPLPRIEKPIRVKKVWRAAAGV